MSKPRASGNGEEIGGKKIKSSVGCGEIRVEYNGEEDLEAAKAKEGELIPEPCTLKLKRGSGRCIREGTEEKHMIISQMTSQSELAMSLTGESGDS
ncbi:hypothetical protein LR48_Vigan05g054700 [Vigna angularis]|uniref:Uncharacterized protein n=1 Tax=Phaseolus angularis TaxID=3914 RepID=A0A0L9UJM7_PHAAN|nr:hypothetical protein LR48_Vigan05g054700 [Vigna angularis]